METSLKVLIVGADRNLLSEVTAAFAGLADVRPVINHVVDHRQGIEAVRLRRFDLAMVEMCQDTRAMTAFAAEVGVMSPETPLVAVFAPEVFGENVSQSAIIIEAIRAGVQDFLRRPLSTHDLGRLLERLVRRSAPRTYKTGKIIAFVANKGGVGKSTLSVNVACALGKKNPGRVLLVDASLQMGVCADMLDLHPQTTITDAARQRDRLDETLVRELSVPHSCGLHLLACPHDAVEAAELDEEIMTRILTLASRSYDYVIVDTFPLVDRVMMAVFDLADTIYVVTESVVPVLRGAVRMMELLDELGLPKERRRLVLNRYSRFAGNLKPADVAARFGRPVDHIIPYEKDLLIAANMGVPYIFNAGRFSGFARAMKALVADVADMTAARQSAHEPAKTEVQDSGQSINNR